MLVRPATAADIPNMVSLERETATAAHWSEAQYQQLFESEAPRRVVLVAEQQGICGFIVLKEAAGEWELENIAVRETDRRQGRATALLRPAVALISTAGGSKIFLEVRESNSVARTFYEKHGFREVGRRKNY